MEQKVHLLYEGDEWLSTKSLVLIGIFTSEKKMLDSAEPLIHREAIRKEGDAEDAIAEFWKNGCTNGLYTNYLTKEATLDKLEEI